MDGFLKCSMALAKIPIVDINRVDLGETLQRRFRLARRFLSYAQIIPQGERAFRIIAGGLQRALIPDGSDGRLAFFHESKSKKRAALHGVTEGAAAIAGFGNFLELANGFLEEPHFTKGDAQVVVRFEVFVFRAHLTQFGPKLEDLETHYNLGIAFREMGLLE